MFPTCLAVKIGCYRLINRIGIVSYVAYSVWVWDHRTFTAEFGGPAASEFLAKSEI